MCVSWLSFRCSKESTHRCRHCVDSRHKRMANCRQRFTDLKEFRSDVSSVRFTTEVCICPLLVKSLTNVLYVTRYIQQRVISILSSSVDRSWNVIRISHEQLWASSRLQVWTLDAAKLSYPRRDSRVESAGFSGRGVAWTRAAVQSSVRALRVTESPVPLTQ